MKSCKVLSEKNKREEYIKQAVSGLFFDQYSPDYSKVKFRIVLTFLNYDL